MAEYDCVVLEKRYWCYIQEVVSHANVFKASSLFSSMGSSVAGFMLTSLSHLNFSFVHGVVTPKDPG